MPGDSGGSCFRLSAHRLLGVAWEELYRALEPFGANVCPSQMRPSYSLSLGTCWTWELPSVRLGLLLPAGQCRLLVPSTVQGGVRKGFSAV